MKRPALINPPLAEGMCALVLGQAASLPLFPAVGPSETMAALAPTPAQPLQRAQVKEPPPDVRCSGAGCGACGMKRCFGVFFPFKKGSLVTAVTRGLAHFSHKL